VSYKPLDAWVEALGAESGADQRTRIVRTADAIQPVALPEWGSEYLAPPSNDSAFMYGSHEAVGTAANRPACLLSQAANPANLDGRQRSCWFWFRVHHYASAALSTFRIVMFVDGPGVFTFVGVGAGSQHAFNPTNIAASRTLFAGNTPTVVTPASGLAFKIVTTTSTGDAFWNGPFFCPANLSVFFAGNQVGVAEVFGISAIWRELPILRR